MPSAWQDRLAWVVGRQLFVSPVTAGFFDVPAAAEEWTMRLTGAALLPSPGVLDDATETRATVNAVAPGIVLALLAALVLARDYRVLRAHRV